MLTTVPVAKVWSMVEGTRLFPDSSGEDRRQSELTHMGRMVSLIMGHPPWDMLQQMRRSALTRFYITPGTCAPVLSSGCCSG